MRYLISGDAFSENALWKRILLRVMNEKGIFGNGVMKNRIKHSYQEGIKKAKNEL